MKEYKNDRGGRDECIYSMVHRLDEPELNWRCRLGWIGQIHKVWFVRWIMMRFTPLTNAIIGICPCEIRIVGRECTFVKCFPRYHDVVRRCVWRGWYGSWYRHQQITEVLQKSPWHHFGRKELVFLFHIHSRWKSPFYLDVITGKVRVISMTLTGSRHDHGPVHRLVINVPVCPSIVFVALHPVVEMSTWP